MYNNYSLFQTTERSPNQGNVRLITSTVHIGSLKVALSLLDALVHNTTTSGSSK